MASWQLDIRADKAAMIEGTIQLWQQWAAEAIADHGFFSVALAGGGTPKALYEALVGVEFPWDKTYVFWGDERYVPADHPDSNYRMAKEALLDHVGIPSENIYPFPTGADNPAADAAAFEATLKSVFVGQDYPTIDCMLLGVGGDGHTASLFPGTEALLSEDWVAVGNKSGEPRLTLTFPAIAASRRVVFWISGAGKADIVKTLLTEDLGLPAQSTRCDGDLIWMCDQGAAAQLPLLNSVN